MLNKRVSFERRFLSYSSIIVAVSYIQAGPAHNIQGVMKLPEDTPEKIRVFRNDYILLGAQDPMELISMEEMEWRYMHYVLKTTGENRNLTARILQVYRKILYRKLQRYEEQ